MTLGQRIDVQKSQEMFILGNFVTGNFSAYDF